MCDLYVQYSEYDAHIHIILIIISTRYISFELGELELEISFHKQSFKKLKFINADFYKYYYKKFPNSNQLALASRVT